MCDPDLAMAAVPASLDLNLQSTYGLLLIGCFFSAAVWGVSLVQTFLYFMMYEKDPWKLKLLILFLIAIDTANEILVLKSVWPALILHWGRVDVLGKSEGTIELIHHVWVAAIVAAAVQSYYTWRIYILSGRKLLIPCLLIPLISWQIIGLAPYNFLALGHAAVSAGKQTQQLTAVAISLRATGAAADILIAGSMVYLLTKPRARFTSTQTLVFRLLILSINSGAWTAILAVLDFISIVAFPVYFTFCVFELPICSLYLSTLLVNLNARKFLSTVPTSMDLAEMSGNRNPSESAGTIHFRSQGHGHHLSTGTAYLSSHPDSEASKVKKITLASPEDTEAEKLEEVV
ncbi:hypothetical protein DFH08DRAFT_334348 [Mycena albidolilacea]|uniref:DUF6534 domain-containing protein n=1 Tax=Mycena albidolilacea TaxID=1033008 RepID=A0AAD7EHQ7_9AGAR|nr:hypothetical protein DFH08DRAFT_334348 [Mycena albidolilacea]